MPQKADFTLKFSLANIEDFSLDAIARSPRNFRPGDLVNACNNVVIECVEQKTPAHIVAMAKFLTVDFFAIAHGTGLYNRQIKLWEALAKTASIQVLMQKRGFLQKEELPDFDMLLLDPKGRTLAVSHYSAPFPAGVEHDYLRSFKEFVKRTKLRQGLSGVFLCYPAPFPESVLVYVGKEVNVRDPLQRYESVLPALGVPIDLFEIDALCGFAPGLPSASAQQIRLVHPDLSKKKSWSSSPVRSSSSDFSSGEEELPVVLDQ
mgnify:FL=1